MVELFAVPGGMLTLTGGAGLSETQLALLHAPFTPAGAIKGVFTARTFALTVSVAGPLPRRYRVSAAVYVLSGKRTTYAPLAYDPFPKPPKSNLYRLTPEETGAEIDLEEPATEVSVPVSLPEPLKVARVRLLLHGLMAHEFDAFAPLPPAL